MNAKTIKFIEKARLVHGDKYDYSNSILVPNQPKITIICAIHGNFTQSLYSHLNGVGCKICANIQRKQTNLLKYGGHPLQNKDIQSKKAQTNLNRYGVEHALQNKQIKEAQVRTMINKYGVENASNCVSLIEKRKQTLLCRYGVTNVFDIDLVQDKINHSNQIKYGGHPTKTPQVQAKKVLTNIARYGTEYAAQSKEVKDKMVQTSLERYGVGKYSQLQMGDSYLLISDFGWLYDQYITQRKTAIQIAGEIGIGDTTVGRYLKRLEIDIRKTHHSYISINWLESIMILNGIYIQHNGNIGEFKIPGTKYKADGYCQETNTIYEFHGDYWHGNPVIYAPNIINTVVNKSMGKLYENTIKREETIRSHGYNLVVVWESEWNLQQKELNNGKS